VTQSEPAQPRAARRKGRDLNRQTTRIGAGRIFSKTASTRRVYLAPAVMEPLVFKNRWAVRRQGKYMAPPTGSFLSRGGPGGHCRYLRIGVLTLTMKVSLALYTAPWARACQRNKRPLPPPPTPVWERQCRHVCPWSRHPKEAGPISRANGRRARPLQRRRSGAATCPHGPGTPRRLGTLARQTAAAPARSREGGPVPPHVPRVRGHRVSCG